MLYDTFGRIVGRLVAHRITECIIEWLRASCMGFVPVFGIEDIVGALRRMQETMGYAMGLVFGAGKVDFSKAFDSLEHQAIYLALKAWGFQGKLGKLVLRVLCVIFRVMGHRGNPSSDWAFQRRGIKTGGPESPVVFLLAILWAWRGNDLYEGTLGDPQELALDRLLLRFRELLYVDDAHLLGIFGHLLQIRVDTLAVLGPPVGLFMEWAKCGAWLANYATAHSLGLSKASKGKVVAPHALQHPGGQFFPVKEIVKVVGGHFSRDSGAMREIKLKEAELWSKSAQLRATVRGAGFGRRKN